MKSGQCVLCVRTESIYIADKVVSKKLTNEQAAKELGVGLPEWVSHYELHVRKKLLTAIVTDIEPIKKNLLNKIEKGTESMNRLISLTEQISTNLQDEHNQMNTRLIAAYAQLEKNVITGLKELAIMEGDINSATTINIQNNTIQVDKLMAIVMEDAPPAFKEVVLERMNKLKL